MGAMARQRPHQVAQKSTRTGLSDFRTSWSKFASVTSTIPLPAMFPSPRYERRAAGRRFLERRCQAGDLYMSASRETRLTYYRNTRIGCMGKGESRNQLAGPHQAHRSRVFRADDQEDQKRSGFQEASLGLPQAWREG